jgi:outer membrane protein TolC
MHRPVPWRRLLLPALSGCILLACVGCGAVRPPLCTLGPPADDSSPARTAAEKPPMVLPAKNLQPSPAQLPLSLDAVLRLAQDQNGQVNIARQRLLEAFAEYDLAGKRWLPEISVGPLYGRHEGGIQDFDGKLLHSSYGSLFAGVEICGKLDVREAAFHKIEAQRKIWQQKGKLSKLTSETLLGASGTYIDWLAARAGLAIARDLETRFDDLMELTRTLAKVDEGVRVELTRLETEMEAQKQATRKLREAIHSAAAKLLYVLGLDPVSKLVPLESRLAPIVLVDARQPLQALIDHALARGPEVRELEGLLAFIDQARARAEGPQKWLPALEVSMAEGAFGAGPGGQSSWDNRWDMGLHLRWNLTEALTARDKRRLADTQIQQARLAHHDLRARLTLGVEEAREASQSALDQLPLCEKQIQKAEATYKLSNSRLKENIKGRSPSEVLQALRILAGARLNYLNTIRDLDKAQLRLFVLTGAVCDN